MLHVGLRILGNKPAMHRHNTVELFDDEPDRTDDQRDGSREPGDHEPVLRRYSCVDDDQRR
jgi:hypothetical protein